MSEAVSPLLQWLNFHPQLAGLVTFLISAAESVAIIGTIVPGSIMMTAIGALAGSGVIPLTETIIWAILGAIAGDGLSYWIGHHFKNRLILIWPFNRYPSMLRTGEIFFYKHGGMSVFIGRFVGPVRALVPLVAGMLGMKPWKFIIANVASAIGWGPAYMLPGILLGAASLELPPGIAIHVILILFLFVLFILLCLWVTFQILHLIHHQTDQVQNEIWLKLKKSRYFSKITFWLKHFNPRKTHGQLHLAIYFIVITFLFIFLAWVVKGTGVENITINQAVFHFFRGIRNWHFDNLMLNFSLFGEKQVAFSAILFSLISFLMFQRKRLALHFFGFAILLAVVIFSLKHTLKIPRPWGLLENTQTFAMPSGHTTIAASLYLLMAFFLSATLPHQRKIFYIIALVLGFLVSISRLYLGAHWFTDVLSGWLVGPALFLGVIISYNRKHESPLPPVKMISTFLLSILLSFSIFHYFYFDRLVIRYTPLDWPVIDAPMQNWWVKNDILPATQVSLFGIPTQKINIEWEGDLSSIKQTLIEQGWRKPPSRDWISTLHRVADVSSTQYLPLISPQYLDETPELILSRQIPGKGLIVIRLWNAHRSIQETNTSLWVGTVNNVPRPYRWILKNHPDEVNISFNLVFSQNPQRLDWEWKTINRFFGNGNPYPVLLIRKKV